MPRSGLFPSLFRKRHWHSHWRVLSGLTLSILLQGCQLFFGGAQIKDVAFGSGKPSNVATLVSVTKSGKPVSALPPSAFAVEENDTPLSAETSQLALLDVARYVAFHTVLLVDISQANQPQARVELAKAAASFVRRARLGQAVTVLVFDGSDQPKEVAEYPAEAHATGPDQVEALVASAPADPSRNLRGAVLSALDVMDKKLAQTIGSVKLGTLAVFSRGPDIASRVAQKQLDSALAHSAYRFVAIDVNGDPHDDTNDRVAEAGLVHAQAVDTLPIAFEEAASIVDGLREQYYLVSYCSPSRAGMRKLRVTVSVPVADGKDERDHFDTQFDATGFTAGCDPQKPPVLLAKGATAPPPPPKRKPEPPKVETEEPPQTVEPPKPPPTTKNPKPHTKPNRAPAVHVEEDEAPVPAKPGYAQ